MGSLQSISFQSSFVTSKIKTRGESIFEYNDDNPINDLSDRIDLDQSIDKAQFLIRPMVTNSLGFFA